MRRQVWVVTCAVTALIFGLMTVWVVGLNLNDVGRRPFVLLPMAAYGWACFMSVRELRRGIRAQRSPHQAPAVSVS